MKTETGTLLCALGLALAVAAPALQAAPAAPLSEVAAQVEPSAEQFRKGTPLPAWVEPIQVLPPTEDKSALVTLLADTQFITGVQRAIHVHLAWQVNAPSAIERATRHIVNFHPAYQRVQLHVLRVHRGGDTTVNKLATSQYTYHQRAVRPEQAAYAGPIMTTIRIDEVRVGDIVEIAYTVEGANPAFGDKFAESTTWDSGFRTETRRVTLLHPQDRKISWRIGAGLSGKPPTPTEAQSGEMRKIRWESHGIAATAVSPGTPSHLIPRVSLRMSEYATWREVARWAEQLFRQDVAATPELDALVANLKAKPTAEERVSGALAWVQAEVRSFATVDLVDISQLPASPAVVVQRKFGDSRDKAFLLLHLLRELGVRARPVLVAQDPRGTSERLPSPFEFNEVIVRAEVDDKEYFLDPMWQGQGGKLAAMGQIWEGAEGLVVQRATAFAQIRSAQPARNEREIKVHLPGFGEDAEIVVRETFTGAHAEVRRVMFREVPVHAMQKVFLEDYVPLYPGVQFASLPEIKDDTANNVLTMVMKLKVPGISAAADASWAIKYGAPDFDTVFQWHTRPDRNQVFALPLKSHFKYTVEAEFPPEVKVTSDAIDRSFREDGFEFTLARRFSGNKGTLTSELNTAGGLLPAKKVDAVTAGVRAIVQREPGAFTVKKEDIKF